MISIRNLRLIATIICNVWLSASLVSPLKKIIRVIPILRRIPAIKLRHAEARLILAIVESKYAVINNSIFNSTNNKIIYKSVSRRHSLNKIFNSSIYSCKKLQEGIRLLWKPEYASRSVYPVYAAPDCNEYYSYHLECQTWIPGKVLNSLIL